jgi:hypothetical protein
MSERRPKPHDGCAPQHRKCGVAEWAPCRGPLFRRDRGMWADAQAIAPCSTRSACEERHKLGDDLTRCLVHQPMAGTHDDDAFDLVIDQAAQRNEKFARCLFAGQDQYRVWSKYSKAPIQGIEAR